MGWFQFKMKVISFSKLFIYDFIRKTLFLIMIGLIIYSIEDGWSIFKYLRRHQHFIHPDPSYIHHKIMWFIVILVIIFLIKRSREDLTKLYNKEEGKLERMKKEFDTEKALFNFLKEHYGKKEGFKLEKNIVLTNKGAKFDLDFALIDEERKIFYAFECKPYNNATIQDDGSLIVNYYGETKTYNPEFQLLSTIKTFKTTYPEYQNYYFVPIVALPNCKNIASNKRSKVYYWIALNNQVLDAIMQRSVLAAQSSKTEQNTSTPNIKNFEF